MAKTNNNYGVPYKGSKTKIAPWVISHLPAGEVLMDLFAGGCAVTHAAMLSGKWGRIIANDIGDAPQLFVDAVAGKFHKEDRWISREDFYAQKDTDPYIRICWSFGENMRDYMYSREIEPWKRALHCARVWGDLSGLRRFGINSDGSRADIIKHMDEYKAKYAKWSQENLRSRGNLQRIERLQDLQSLERLQRLQSLERLQSDYRAVDIPAGAIIYCDPPYKGTNVYTKEGFDHEEFYRWVRECPNPVYFSEYTAPKDFKRVACIQKANLLCATKNKAFNFEFIFWNGK